MTQLKNIYIPNNIKVVFVFSTGQKEFLNRKFYHELSEIYFWMASRVDEFQYSINLLSSITDPGKISILEINHNGEKEIIENVKLGDYSLRK